MTVLEAAPRLLAQEDPAAGELLRAVFESEGIKVWTDAKITTVNHDHGQYSVEVNGHRLTSTQLLVATGRAANLAATGLDAIGLDTGARWISVDDHLRAADGVWAVGDVTGRGAFTHVAMYQAAIGTRSILGLPGPPANYSALPRVTFTDPEIGAVGLTEAQARQLGRDIRIGTAQVRATARGWLHKTGNDGFITVIEDTATGTLIGATSAGPAGGEVLGALALAVHAQVPVSQLETMIYAYPTFHRGIEDAIRNLSLNPCTVSGRDLGPVV